MIINKYFKASGIFFLLFLSFFFTNKIYTQTDDSLYYTNPDYHVANELFNKRIIMLGDYAHHQPGPYHRVHKILDNWLQICLTKNESIKLTYIIEAENALANEINKYLMTGDLQPVIDKLVPEFYLIDLEYYSQLRKFYQKVDSVNQTRNNKLSFTVKGFEEIGSVNFEKLAILPQRESELWFINERDSTTAMGLIDYAKSNPDDQILMFYGGFHLLDGYINKNIGFYDLTEKEYKGYCLVHYLKNEFGSENVTSYFTINYLDNFVKNPALDSITGNNFITKPENLNNPEFHYDNVDYVFSCYSNFYPQLEGFHIYSKYIFEKIHDNLKIVKKWLPGYKATLYYNWYLGTLSDLCKKKFIDDDEFEDWLNNNTYDGIEWIFSDRFSDSIKTMIESKNINPINQTFAKYGIAFKFSERHIKEFDKFAKKDMPSIIKQIVFMNSIGIYWIGYPEEKVKAKEYLIQFSGEDYQEPERYLQWYRMKYCGFKY